MTAKTWIKPIEWEEGKVIRGDDIIYLPPVSRGAQTQLRSRGKISYTKVAREIIYALEDIYNYIESNRVLKGA